MKTIAVIGCGSRMNYVLKCLPGLGEDISISHIYDPRPLAAKKLAQEYCEGAVVSDDWKQMISSTSSEWIFIASPNHAHAEQVIAAFEAGKNVFCEKPLALTLEDCDAMKAAWKKSGKMFCIGFTLRYSPHYRKIKEIIDSGKLGKVTSIEFNETLHFDHGGYIHGDWRRLTEYAGTHMLEKCSHDIDLLQWFVGSTPKKVASFGGLNFFTPQNEAMIDELGPAENGRPAFSAWKRVEDHNPFTADKDIIDNQVAILEFHNGARASFHTNCSSMIPERRMYICGTRGTIRADVIQGKIEFRQLGYDTQLECPETGASGNHGDGDIVLGEELAAAIHRGVTPSAGFEDGYNAALCCYALDKALNTGAVVGL